MNVFPIAPAESRYLWFLIPIGLVLIGVIVLLTVSLRGAHSSRFEVTPTALRLSGDLFSRTIPLTELRLDMARRIDLEQEPQYKPAWKRGGTSLPGYQSGWFRLKNGEKALLYLTDRSKAVYIPTSRGYSLLLSPNDPAAFLSALRGGR